MVVVVVHPQGHPRPLHIEWKGLDPNSLYKVVRAELQGVHPGLPAHDWAKAIAGQKFTGAQLMYAGQTLPQLYGDYPSVQILIRKTR